MSACSKREAYPKKWKNVNNDINILNEINGNYKCDYDLFHIFKLSYEPKKCSKINMRSNKDTLIISVYSNDKIIESKVIKKDINYEFDSNFNNSSLKIIDDNGKWVIHMASGYGFHNNYLYLDEDKNIIIKRSENFIGLGFFFIPLFVFDKYWEKAERINKLTYKKSLQKNK